jgi:hypothetical protein
MGKATIVPISLTGIKAKIFPHPQIKISEILSSYTDEGPKHSFFMGRVLNSYAFVVVLVVVFY